MSQLRKSWADREGIPTGVMGETVNGVRICEDNRATVYVRNQEDIAELRDIMVKNYRSKGVDAVLFGVWRNVAGRKVVMYAIYVQDNFLINE